MASTSSQPTIIPDIICEFIEVAIHNIIYARKLYPASIFEKRRKFGVPVYQAIHPGVCDYIKNSIKAINFHLKNKQLESVFLCFHQNGTTSDRYRFNLAKIADNYDTDAILLQLENHFRDITLKILSSADNLEELSADDANFSIDLKVNAYSSLKLNQNPKFEDFPWIRSQQDENYIADLIYIHTITTNTVKSRKRKSRHDSHQEGSSTSSKRVKGIFKKDDLDDSLSTSDWGLSVDENQKHRKRDDIIKLNDEPLSLTCAWDNCAAHYTDYAQFNEHLELHLVDNENQPKSDCCTCLWYKCDYQAVSVIDLNSHLCFHGYHTKLKSIGSNVESREKMPECIQSEKFKIPINDYYKCEWLHCGEMYYKIYDFLKHVQIHVFHNPKGVKEGIIHCKWKGCSIKTSFISQYRLTQHMRSHTKEKLVACPSCGFLFATKTKLADHRFRQLPSNLQTYLCSQCSKNFPSERLLRDHMRLHINQYKCAMCDMTCSKPSVLAKHIRHRHLKEAPFKCQHCSYSGISKHNLDTHLKTHTNENFKCTECKYECKSAYGLAKHLRDKHNKDTMRTYECHNCKKRFIRGGLLTRHLIRIHNYHWPSGHTRFRYKKDADKIYRLQTVRYETLDVTQEILQGKTVPAPSQQEKLKVSLKRKDLGTDDDLPNFEVKLNSEDSGDDIGNTSESRKTVVITIDDLDAKGNVLKTQTIESTEIVCDDLESGEDSVPKEVIAYQPSKEDEEDEYEKEEDIFID